MLSPIASSSSASSVSQAAADASLEILARDEDFWAEVARGFAPKPPFVQLDFGYYHPATLATLEVEIRAMRELNVRGSHYKRTQMRPDQEKARSELARIAGVSSEEIAITRNATEALNTLIHGLELSPGDEIVYSDQDYGSMVEALEQKAQRFGVVLRKVAIPLYPQSDEAVVEAFAVAVNDRTRFVHVTHVINYSGQILPVRKICDRVHALGAEVIVDAAHSFAHLAYRIPDLGCDYLGASLHKWLCSPLGMGMLYVRREKIANVWPLLADTRLASTDIRRLEHLGNRSESAHLGLIEAIRFHEQLGPALKLVRLRYLQRSWTDAVRNLPRVTLLTPSDPNRHGAIGAFAIEGMTPRALADHLMKEYRIFTVGFEHSVVRGVRVTPGLPTSRAEIDQLVEAVRDIAGKFD